MGEGMRPFGLACCLVILCGVCAAPDPALAGDWPQWRGPGRDGHSPEVPATLPALKLLWKQALAGETHAGIAVAAGCVVVPDHGAGVDIIRCFAEEDGKPLWQHTLPNKAKMDFGAAPRATPLLHDGSAYVLTALGDLLCLELASGKVQWQTNLPKAFGAKLPQWGYCSSPLIAGGRLIVNPGAPQAAVVGLDPKTGAVAWKSPGKPPAYGSFIAGTFGGVEQVVGCEEGAIVGWNPVTGARLWRLVPENVNDYLVSTPLNLDGRLLCSTDANYTRLYSFAAGGKIIAQPSARSEELGPDTATPVALNGLVFGPSYGLTCLDAAAGLKLLWREEKEEALTGFFTAIAGNNRVMVFTEKGILFLVAADRSGCRILGRAAVCQKTWSHPALANGRLFIRDAKTLYCYDLRGS